MESIHRRRFLEIILCSSAIVLPCIGYTYNILKRKKSYRSPEEIATIIKERGINPNVISAQGKRTLLIIGDMHLGFGESYFNLLKNLENKIEIDRIFMEGVYDHFVQPDPYYAAMLDSAKIGCSLLNKDFKEKDEQGYYKISNEFLVNGIENKNLFYESLISETLTQEVLRYRVRKDSDNLKRIKQLSSQLKNRDFNIDNLSKISDDQLKKIIDCLMIKNEKINIIDRNNQFIGIIDKKLENYEVGVLIVGENHINNEKRFLKHIDVGKYNLLEDMALKGIGSCYIDAGQVVSFNKSYN